ncbi:MAG: lysophospholipid acyltransferase family protein [Bacteroidetes bacterium]|nr:lysophospholipid acyltransferase family protein [Bacteroidota bacterium]MCL6101857.1 lysophospholipid acyltransferase family protein [Bacteroidota bacterium]
MDLRAKTGYYLLRAFTWMIQLFPLRFHYILSDFIFLLVYYLVRYRRKVVYTNLTNSFPEKSKKEISLIARKFYRQFCDSFIETLYFDRISEKEIKKRLTLLNQEILEKFLAERRPVILALGHYNNWEWNCSWPLNSKYKGYVIYKKLTNKSFDLFYYNMRSRFGIVPLERADTYRKLIADQNNGQAFASAFLMDQTPRKHEIQYWTTFLNQDTPVLTGTEKVARKLDAAVLFCLVRKLKRGYNQLEFSVIVEHAKDTQPFEITEKATRLIEDMILQRPELWLWSHKRWKHRRERPSEG